VYYHYFPALTYNNLFVNIRFGVDLMDRTIQKRAILTISCSILILFCFINLSSFSTAQSYSKEVISSTNLPMQEFTSLKGEFNDTTSIELTLPDNTWNITDISLNFTNIHQNNYSQVVTGGGAVYGLIQKVGGIYGLANEIQLEHSINLSNVELYCYQSEYNTDQIYVQIHGYDPYTQLPNSTVYGTPVLLNVSTTPNWYVQKFAEPIILPAGRYYLVINASQLEEEDVYYYWKYGDLSPLQSAYFTTNWSITPIHCNLCYKLNQEKKFYTPNEINMQINITGILYNVLDDQPVYSGYLEVNNLNIEAEDNFYSLYISTNISSEIYFDYFYEISVDRYFSSNGTCHIIENSYNIWNFTPNISRHGYNQTIRFKCSSNWNDITIYKDNVDITSLLLYEEDFYYFTNTTISNDSDWLITARSYLHNYEFDDLDDKIAQGEVIHLTVRIPEGNGVAILKIFNSQGIEIHNETKIVDSEIINFNYTIPSFISKGMYYAYVFWHNNVDAGVQSQAFYIVSMENSLNEILFFISIISCTLFVLGGLSSYLVVKARRNKKYRDFIPPNNEVTEFKKMYESVIYNKFVDIFNLQSIIISERSSGLYIFEKKYTGETFDPLIISGFVQAIKMFGQEIIMMESTNQILYIEYEGLNIYIVEVNEFDFILLMKGKPSNKFLLAIDNLVEEIDYRYGNKIENFTGDISKFEGISDLIEKYIDVHLLTPYQFNSNLEYSFEPEERDLLYKIYNIMKKTNQKYFYFYSILSENKFDLRNAEIILKFIQENIFVPKNND